MKKFTLLAIAALAAGTQMGYADELPGGIITSTKEAPVYYTITNMRADRLNYVDGWVYNADHDEQVSKDDGSPYLPEYLPNESETPQIWEFPYMGLALCENKFWTAFSAMPEVMDPKTTYWWFELKPGTKGVYIHNAIIDGALKNKAENVLGRPSMSFSESAKQAYYVIPLTEDQINDELELGDDEFALNAFALSKEPAICDKNGEVGEKYYRTCLDMNNYITFNYEAQMTEDGEPLFKEEEDEDGNVTEVPVMGRYGFAGVNLYWNPLNRGGNDNYKTNNGSLFQVTKVEDVAAVEQAIEDYKEIVRESYRNLVKETLEKGKEATIARISCLKNLPELYTDAAKIDAIMADISGMTVDPSKVNEQKDVDVYEAQINMNLEAQYVRALQLAGDKTVVTFQQMFAQRDWGALSNAIESENLGNAYLSSFGEGQMLVDGSMEEMPYNALNCVLEADMNCEWTLEWVSGQGYMLKNGDNYIRQFGNWDGFDQIILDQMGEDILDDEDDNVFNHVDKNVRSWALTTDPALAAIFTFSAADEAVVEGVTLNEEQTTLFNEVKDALGYADETALFTTTDICHLNSTDPAGNAVMMIRDTSTHRYIVDNWVTDVNRYYAAQNCWKVKRVQAGEEIPDGIEEVKGASKVAGIYDLQGRKVAKAGKGLYIINGVKTLVK